eukprot:5657844-Prymnesium_polylepis.1
MSGRDIDLYRLHRVVNDLGGYHLVTQEKKWGDVGQLLKLREASHCAYALRQHYSKWLLQFAQLEEEIRLPDPREKTTHYGGVGTPHVDAVEAKMCSRGVFCTVLHSSTSSASICSWNSLALQVQDLEERIPWDAVQQGELEYDCDWTMVRPSFLQLMRQQALREGGWDCRTVAQALLTLE